MPLAIFIQLPWGRLMAPSSARAKGGRVQTPAAAGQVDYGGLRRPAPRPDKFLLYSCPRPFVVRLRKVKIM